MSLTLAIADKADATGATATISGSGGASGVIQVQKPGGTGWTTAASFTGDGSVDLPLFMGYYWGVAVAAPDISNLVYFPVTRNADAVEYRCLTAAQAGIQTLCQAGSIGINAERVYVKMVLDDKNARLPAVFLTPTDSEQVLTSGTNTKDDVSYPVVVQIVDRNSQDYTGHLPDYLLWRERIMRYFRNQRLAGVPEIYTCQVVPEAIFDQGMANKNLMYMVSPFVLRFLSRELRGV